MIAWINKILEKFGKKEVKQLPEENTLTNPRLLFELVNNCDTIAISAQWPVPLSQEQAMNLIKGYANMLLLIIDGKLNKTIENSVLTYGEDNKIQVEIGKGIVKTLHLLLENEGISMNEDNDVVISPREVFAVRGNN